MLLLLLEIFINSFILEYTWGYPKIPGIVKKIYLQYLYKVEILDNVSSIGSGAGMLRPVAGGVLRRGLKFQTCTNTLKNFF